MSLMENSAPGSSTKENVPEETPKACVSFLLPLPLYLQGIFQFLEHLSSEGAIVCQWGSPKDRGWSWEIHLQDIWCPGDRAKLFQPIGSTILGVKYVWFLCRWARLDLEIGCSCR